MANLNGLQDIFGTTTPNDKSNTSPTKSVQTGTSRLSSLQNIFGEAEQTKAPATIAEKPAIAETPKKSLWENISSLASKASGFLAGAAEEPTYNGNSWGETLKNLPNEIVRTILPGAAVLNDNPELAKDVSNLDVAKEIPKALFESFASPVASYALTFYGATNKVLKSAGLDTVGTDASDPSNISFDIPYLGKVTNVQARIASDYATNPVPNTKLGTIGAVAKYTGTELLNGLYAASLVSDVVNPRLKTIASIDAEQSAQLGRQNTIGNTNPQAQLKSFNLYTKPTIKTVTFTKLNPEFVTKLTDVGIDMSKYDPANPTFFKFEMNPTGQITGQVIQIKPSYLDSILGKIGSTSSTEGILGLPAVINETQGGHTAPSATTQANAALSAELAKMEPADYTVLTQKSVPTSAIVNQAPVTGELNSNETLLSKVDPKTLDMRSADLQDHIDTLQTDYEKNPDPLLAEKISILQSQLVQFQDATKELRLSVVQNKNTIAQLFTFEYSNGKYAYSINANTPNYGISTNFNTSEKYATEEDAITAGKQAIISWANNEMPKADGIDKTYLQNIVDSTKQPNIGNVPLEVRVKDREPAQIQKEIADTYTGVGQAKAEEAIGIILMELDLSQAGYRIITGTGAQREVKGVPSTFPKWIPEELRSKALFEKLYANLDLANLKMPTGNKTKQRALFNLLLDAMDERLGVDTRALRKELTQIYENKQGETAKRSSGGTEGSKGGGQKEAVKKAVSEEAKSIKQIADETKIKEPNVRRILGVGAKEGTFARVDKGVYKLTVNGEDLAYIETGSALEILPRLAKDGFKSDMVFLDIPYDTPAIKGGNRGMEYNLISVSDFGKILDSIKEIARTEDTPVVHMYSQAPSGMVKMQKYNDMFLEKGFIPVGKGELQKTFKDGKPVTNVRGEVSKPEGILVFTQSGKLKKDLENLNYKLVRPKGYQSEKPAEMLASMIKMTTEEGDVVLDPFAGSGVTGAEAVKAGRKAYLIEKDKNVAENVTIPRVKNVLPSTKASNEFKVGDVFDTGGNTNMADPITVREIVGNTLKFTDAKGNDFAGMTRSVVRDLVKGESWKKVENKDKPVTKNIISPDQILFHGTIEKNLSSINEKGLLPSNDNASTYGKAIYVTADKFEAEGYGHEQALIARQKGTGNQDFKLAVVEIKPTRQLNLYTPTEAERLEIIDLFGKEQQDYIDGLLGDKYDGFRIKKPTEYGVSEEIVIYDPKLLKVKVQPEKLPAYQNGAKNANIGEFRSGTATEPARIEPIQVAHLDTVKPIEMPELVRLARELSGSIPKVKAKVGRKFGGQVRGVFKPDTGKVELNADIFADPEGAAKTLAHEIGHLIDWLPDKMMARGNLLGRLRSLRNFTKSIFGGSKTGLFGKENIDLAKIRNDALRSVLKDKGIGYGDYITKKSIRESLKDAVKARYTELVDATGGIRNSTVKKELQAVSEYWKPYDKEASSPSYVAYRNSAEELYADAISVLFNSPATLERMAPTFYKEFFAGLDTKPEVKAEYFELQALLHGSTEELFAARKDDIRKGFQKAEAIQAGFAEKTKLGMKSYWERLRQQLDDINYPILKKQAEAEARGAVIPESENVKFALQEQSFADNENFLMVENIDRNVVKPIEKAGMTIDDLGEYLLLDRIQKDRADIANPFGFNPKNATQQMEHMKSLVGEENFTLLQEKAQVFHDIVFKSVEEAVATGAYNKEVFETRIKPNKDSYASFQVVDYMQDHIPATIKGQVGTLKEVANPFVSTILKTVALNRLNAYQRAKNATIKLLQDQFPDEITETKSITTDGRLRIFKVARDKGAIEVLVDGKMKSYDVDPYIAESFKRDKVGDLNVIISLIDKFNNKLFKPLVTTYNLGFAAAFNPKRDFTRNYKLIPNATVLNLLQAYAKSFPSAVKYSKGQLDDFTRSLVESKAINAPVNDYNFDPRNDELGRILERYGLIKSTEKPLDNKAAELVRKVVLKPVVQVLEGIRFIADTFEIASKVAGAKVRMAGGESGKELAYNLRNFTGTPNYKVRGKQTDTTNALFVFSNIMKEGLKADFRFATDPKTRSGYWWKTVKVDLLPKFLMFLASAGLLGTTLKKFYDNASEYDKSNYIIIPLGVQDDGKSIYMRVPHDETGRLVSVAFWKMANMVKDGGSPKDLQDIFSVGAGQLPSVSPIIDIASGWVQYLSGRNPYDAFHGRTLIDDTTWQAGGGAALKKMVQWTANTAGLAKFATYDTSKQSGVETFMQVAPFFSSVIKISDYGQQEKLKSIANEQKSKDAKQTLKEREIINKYAEKARNETSTLFAVSKYKNQVINDILGHAPRSKEEQDKASAITTKFSRAVKRGNQDDPRVVTLIDAQSNNQKREILKSIKSDMTTEEWSKFRTGLLQDKIVSEELVYGIK